MFKGMIKTSVLGVLVALASVSSVNAMYASSKLRQEEPSDLAVGAIGGFVSGGLLAAAYNTMGQHRMSPNARGLFTAGLGFVAYGLRRVLLPVSHKADAVGTVAALLTVFKFADPRAGAGA